MFIRGRVNNMNGNESSKIPHEYRSILQLTGRNLSIDYTNYFNFRMPFDTIAMLIRKGKTEKASEIMDTLQKDLRQTKTYSERYLNEDELRQAAQYGITREDLVNDETEPVIQRLDEMANRCRLIGDEIALGNYENFVLELGQMYAEVLGLIEG